MQNIVKSLNDNTGPQNNKDYSRYFRPNPLFSTKSSTLNPDLQ